MRPKGKERPAADGNKKKAAPKGKSAKRPDKIEISRKKLKKNVRVREEDYSAYRVQVDDIDENDEDFWLDD